VRRTPGTKKIECDSLFNLNSSSHRVLAGFCQFGERIALREFAIYFIKTTDPNK